MKVWIILAVYLVADVAAYRGYHYKRWKSRKPVCDPVKCEEDCEEVPTEGGCPKCVCKPKCPLLDCEKECKVQGLIFKEEIKDGPCLKCECEIIAEFKEKEDDFKEEDFKDYDLKEDDFKEKGLDPVKKFDPRNKGIMEKKCSPPKCPPGCFIEDEFDGPCPGCKCEDEKFPDVKDIKDMKDIKGMKKGILDVKCSPPKCPPGCFIEEFFDGPCPGCKCEEEEEKFPEKKEFKPACLPPKCPPGCEIEKEFDGPCPGCKCFKPDIRAESRKIKPMIQCSPPKCPPGCEIEKFFDGPCPGCKCDKEDDYLDIDEKKECVPLKSCFGPNCKKEFDDKGCEICICKPICDPPKCPRRCKIDNSGECPKCVCKPFKWFG